jgi:hypothetical protein
VGSRIGGYDVAYTHRGSWKAYRRLGGVIIDQVPIAMGQRLEAESSAYGLV